MNRTARVARRSLSTTLLMVVLLGCFEERDRPTIPIFGSLAVNSDPQGAEIFVDRRSLGAVTPVTLDMVPAGEHLLTLVLGDGTPEVFTFSDSIVVPEEALDSVEAALQGGCLEDCPFVLARGRMECRITGAGDTCAGVFFDQPALEWPAGSGADYGGGGRLLVAGIIGDDGGQLAGDTLAIPVFKKRAWIGRRPVAREVTARRQELDVEYWARSSFAGEYLQGLSVLERGISVDSAGVEDVVLLQFEVVNNSDDPLYRALFPWIPEGGYTIRDMYLGYGLDADVGRSDDDLGTVDPELNLSFLYDADFSDSELPPEFRDRPAVVGIATILPPEGATRRTLTFWRLNDDWDEGAAYGFAWRLLSGQLAADDPIDDHPAAEIGHYPSAAADYRTIESWGPLSLAPGESTLLTVGLLLAEPVAGTFTPGTRVDPGDPTDPGRQILQVAGDLRALAAQLNEFWTRYRR